MILGVGCRAMAVAGQHTSAEVSLEQLGSPAQMRTQGGSLDSLLGWGEGCNWAPPPTPIISSPWALRFEISKALDGNPVAQVGRLSAGAGA